MRYLIRMFPLLRKNCKKELGIVRKFIVVPHVILLIIIFVFLYMSLIESRWISITEKHISVANKSNGKKIKIVHISDLHSSKYVSFEFLDKVIGKVIGLNPDLIIITGDFITGGILDYQKYKQVLSKLQSAAPTFACLGNHDGGKWALNKGGYYNTKDVKKLLFESGIRVLVNSAASLEINNRKFDIIGLGDLWAGECEPAKAFKEIKDDKNFRIVLVHNPDSKEFLFGYKWDLMLAGHTHGGQLKLPIIGTPFAPVEDHKFVEGLHEWEGRHININRGIGNLYGMRFNARPEISVIKL